MKKLIEKWVRKYLFRNYGIEEEKYEAFVNDTLEGFQKGKKPNTMEEFSNDLNDLVERSKVKDE